MSTWAKYLLDSDLRLNMKGKEISSTLGYINLIYILIPGLQYYVNHFTPTGPMCQVNVDELELQSRLLEKRAYFPL